MAVGRQTVLVTGASTGLGLALARRLIGDTKHRLVLTARSNSLRRFAAEGIVESEDVMLRPLDVTRDDERRRLIQEVDERWGGVDVLLNNAGVSYRSVLEHVTEKEFLSQMLVNYVGPVELARLVLPSMRYKRAGRIINVSSVGGMMAMPTMAIYSASKFALEGATEALYYEVKPWNIKVSLIQPGFINSNSFEKVRLTAASERSVGDHDEAYHKHYDHMASFIAKLMRLAFATPDSIARHIVDIMHRRNPPLRSLVTLDAWVFAHLRRFLPRAFYHWLLYQSLPGVREWGAGPNKALPPPVFADAPTYIPPSMAPNLSAAYYRFAPPSVPSGHHPQAAPVPSGHHPQAAPVPSGPYAQTAPAPSGPYAPSAPAPSGPYAPSAPVPSGPYAPSAPVPSGPYAPSGPAPSGPYAQSGPAPGGPYSHAPPTPNVHSPHAPPAPSGPHSPSHAIPTPNGRPAPAVPAPVASGRPAPGGYAPAPSHAHAASLPLPSHAQVPAPPHSMPGGPHPRATPPPMPSGRYVGTPSPAPAFAQHAPMPNVGQTQPAGTPPGFGARPANPAALLPAVALPSSPPPPPLPNGAGAPPPMPSQAFGSLPRPLPGGAMGTAPQPLPGDADPGAGPRANDGGRRSTLQLSPRFSRGVG